MLYPMPGFGRTTKEKQMKPFDLESAKAGKLMLSLGGHTCRFVGMHSSGAVVAEEVKVGSVIRVRPENLYMIDEPKKYYVNVYRDELSGSVSVGDANMDKPTMCRKPHHEYIKTIEFEA
jgi:hypothetical protein